MRAIVDEFGSEQTGALVPANPAYTATGIEPSLNAHSLGDVIRLPNGSPDEHPETDTRKERAFL